MVQIVDRRLNGKNKSAVNRQKFLRRYKEYIKKAVADAISKRSISDIDKGESISIPSKDISEPTFRHGQGGKREFIHPGNKEFIQGDKVKRPLSQSGSKGSKASDSGEGEDEFVFQISREEFLEFFFDDLELPNLIKTKLATIKEFKKVRAGHTNDGVPTNINIIRSLRGAHARKIATRAPYKNEIKALVLQITLLETAPEDNQQKIKELREKIAQLEQRIKKIPFIDTFDLRYNNYIAEPKPTTQAVMFCIMDISGSMGQNKKDISKRFFMLLYLFLHRNYEKIEIVFIAHHTIAKEVDEEEFFYSRETGGTVVSSALKLTMNILRERFPVDDWNIYIAQASDGDDWNNDPEICRNILLKEIMSHVQYYAYIEITEGPHQRLWREYMAVRDKFVNFAMKRIETTADIYPIFRELFKKKHHE